MRDSTPAWPKILAEGFSTAKELLEFLQLPTTLGAALAERSFKTRVPRRFAQLMAPGNPRDPLLLQVLAVHDELETSEAFVKDPLEEKSVNPVPGLIHKYFGRVLLTLTGSCAINCRYCFRRHFPYQENNPGRRGWQSAIDYIAGEASIHEVILSGGDPLLAKDDVLKEMMTQLALIQHVRILRIHTRIPVVLPERMTPELLDLFAASRFQKVIVLHSNHPQELDRQTQQACADLRAAHCHLLNQSVLLAGVNDDAAILASLSHKLFEFGVLPYYLHQLDRVQGAAHFEVSKSSSHAIYQTLQSLLPGYLVPRLVCEKPGAPNKILAAMPN